MDRPNNFKNCDLDQLFLLSLDIRDLLPQDHLVWFITEIVTRWTSAPSTTAATRMETEVRHGEEIPDSQGERALQEARHHHRTSIRTYQGSAGILTPTDVGTIHEEGKQVIESEGKRYILELPQKADVPFRGGHLDATVLGARAVYVGTTHCDKKGRPKLVMKCTLPLTGAKVVSAVVTEFALFRKIDGKMVLCEIAPEVTEEEVKANTAMDYTVSPDLCTMKGIE
jgi:hypothetical protein